MFAFPHATAPGAFASALAPTSACSGRRSYRYAPLHHRLPFLCPPTALLAMLPSRIWNPPPLAIAPLCVVTPPPADHTRGAAPALPSVSRLFLGGAAPGCPLPPCRHCTLAIFFSFHAPSPSPRAVSRSTHCPCYRLPLVPLLEPSVLLLSEPSLFAPSPLCCRTSIL